MLKQQAQQSSYGRYSQLTTISTPAISPPEYASETGSAAGATHVTDHESVCDRDTTNSLTESDRADCYSGQTSGHQASHISYCSYSTSGHIDQL